VNRVLGRLSDRRFLARYWQRRPLVVRGAFPRWRDPVEPEELAGLACEPGVDSRLVIKDPWRVFEGPQRPARLRALPATRWTLLVQQVDRWLPAVAALRRPFRFLPTWRLDDVMVSYATKGGGVGPHVDLYDVFLVQGRGRRRWRIAQRFDPALLEGIDLRVLRRFRAEQEWVLEPGDMLYLPPGVAHEGVALEPCLTFSIGFRAPSTADLALVAAQALIETGARERLVSDRGRPVARRAGEIDPASLRRMREHVRTALAEVPIDVFARQVGDLLTTPRGEAPAPRRAMPTSAVASRLRKGHVLERTPGTRVAWSATADGALLFVDGRSFSLAGALPPLAAVIAAREIVPASALPSRPDVVALVRALVASGSFALRAAPR
jgi:50S ribosomal protein L16 3-hydroxylase